VQIARFPVTWPIAEIAAGLNAYRPTTLVGYASALTVLAAEARAGRLRIAPRRIVSTAEPLAPHARSAIEQAFGAPLSNTWGTWEPWARASASRG